MKKYIIKIFILFTIISFTTCTEEKLELDNKNELTVQNWYKTRTDFQMAVNSCYTPFMDQGMFGKNYMLMFHTFSDRTLFETTGRDNISMSSSSGDPYGTYRALYYGVYRTSMVISKLKENKEDISKIENLTQADYDYFMGQAKAMRGAMYFYLVTIFNKPPFYTDENIPVDYLQNFKNGAPEDFWTQLEIDLSEAIPLLKPKSESEAGRITKNGARGMLGKALLYKHYHFYAKNGNSLSAEDRADLTTAKNMFEDIMESGESSLVQPLAPKKRNDYIYALLSNSSHVPLVTENNTYPSENNQESIWEVQFGSGPILNSNVWLPGWMSPGSLNFLWFGSHNESYRNHQPHPNIYYEFETEGAPAPFDRDPRCYATLWFDDDTLDFREESAFYNKPYTSFVNNKGVARARGLNVPTDAGWGGTNDLGIKKYFFPTWNGGQILAPDNDPTNKRIIRYADILLMYAEVCLLLNEDTGDGLAALNKVRQRVDMPDVTSLTREAIIHERDVELAFEGHRWFDLIRWSFDDTWNIDFNELHWGIDADNSVIPFVQNKHEYLPIPLNEIDLSEGQLKQNPGW